MGKRSKFTSSSQNHLTIFIACSKTKKSYKTRASDLYQGALFKKALRYAFTQSNSIFILSAKYGILSLEQEIEPYDKTLNKMTKKEVFDWVDKVKKQMISKNIKPPVLFLTGSNYNKYFEGEKPLSGLSLGFQLKWFNQKLNNQNNFIYEL